MITLGIHDGHCASACLMIEGQLVALVAEERFTRLKNDHGYPKNAIEFCLNAAGITVGEVDQIAFASSHMHTFSVGLRALATFDDHTWLRIQREYWYPKIYRGEDHPEVFLEIWRERFSSEGHFYDFSAVESTPNGLFDKTLSRSIRLEGVKRHLNVPTDKIKFYDHHSCHAYYAFYGSHIRANNTMVYTLDGGGDATTSSLFQYVSGELRELTRSNAVDVARIYRQVTHLLGMKLGEHEFKVMGLAPYVTDREFEKSREIFDDMFQIENDLIVYAPGRKLKDLHFALRDAFEGHRFDGIAAAVQYMCEESVTKWFEHTQRKYESCHAVFSGGVAMNVKLNMHLADLPVLNDFYVCPSPTDDTLCAGACYMAAAEKGAEERNKLQPIRDPYLGPEFGRSEVRESILKSGANEYSIIKENISDAEVAVMLSEGKVISRSCGKMEFGQRALGNRSILADPRSEETVERINRQIKYRDFWMPFAPVILEENAQDYIEAPNVSIQRPYMMIGAKTTLKGQKELKGAIHKSDLTARPQVLSRSQNSRYYDIVKSFGDLTGTPALLNTSFNLHGEPIVCTPTDAISTFSRSDLDVLLMEGFALIRR